MGREQALSVHNLPFLEALLEAWQEDPSSVDPEWIPLLEGAAGDPAPRTLAAARVSTGDVNAEQLQLQVRVDQLVEAYRLHGHVGADFDPLGRERVSRADVLELSTWGLDDSHLGMNFHSSGVLPAEKGTLQEILDALRATYCRHVGVEYWSLPNIEEREWLRARMESTRNRVVPDQDAQRQILRTLANVAIVDEFLHSKFLGAKRFSVSGAESMIPMLQFLIEEAADQGVGEVIFGMAHRGRLNVLMNVLGKTPAEVFSEFEKGKQDVEELLGAGDVKYHLGYHRYYETHRGKKIYLALAFNPSHLEAITPVISGRVRAKQDAQPDKGFAASLGVTLHGDAAFAGQGVVAETLNMSQLEGYTTGGVVRVVINNQVGFTTNPGEGRSGMYCTDVAHILQVPVFHVNGDDPEACAYVAQLAVEYRQRFHRDVIIDVICYRKFGHNEGDDPTFTQPKMYGLIKAHKSVYEKYKADIVERGTLTEAQCKTIDDQFNDEFTRALEQVRAGEQRAAALSPMHGLWKNYAGGPEPKEDPGVTRETAEEVRDMGQRLLTVPEGFNLHRKLGRLQKEMGEMYAGQKPFNWAAAELLAYATLLHAGHPVRISGQDSRRGTFSHRHAVWRDGETGEAYSPLHHLREDQAKFAVHNSPLSEFSVLGFEFGYSLAAPFALVIWEAQFGDFANGAQVIIDQFLSSSEDKWNRISGLAMLLPHGYEGQGPEHSSARLERFLQMCAEDNMQICNLTTPAQMFHVLRRQVLREWRKPLVIMSPKSLLRFRPSFSPIDDLTTHGFEKVIPDPEFGPTNAGKTDGVRRVIACSGKVFYDLAAHRETLGRNDVALVRVEQLYPWPTQELEAELARYPMATELVWAQEEPKNMGPWSFVAPRLSQLASGRFAPRYAGRKPSASPATGSPDAHQLELKMLLDQAYEGLVDRAAE